MRIAITGGLGYIGSLLLARTPAGLRRGVTVIDNAAADPVAGTVGSPLDLVNEDILTANLDRALAGADVVVHLAAIVGATAGQHDPALMNEINVNGTRRVAEACLRTGAPLVFPSTTSVYGSRRAVVDEQCTVAEIRPQTAYAWTKRRGELVLETLARRGLRYTILRCGSAFGPSITLGLHTAINRLCWQAAMGDPLLVWRTAQRQRRPYLHVEDAVGAIQFVLARRLFTNDVYHVVSANATMDEVLAVIGGGVPAVKVTYVDAPEMNDLSYAVSAERLRESGFAARGTLEQGVRDNIRAYRQRCAVA